MWLYTRCQYSAQTHFLCVFQHFSNDEIILDPAAASAEPGIEVEVLAAPFREDCDRVIEGAGVARTQFEQPRELRRGRRRL
jgi:hypothetical protein